MARLRTNVLHWGNKYDGPNDYKHGRRGALDDAFWDEDELVDYVKAKKKDKRYCPKEKGKVACQNFIYVPSFWYTDYQGVRRNIGSWQCTKCCRKKWRYANSHVV